MKACNAVVAAFTAAAVVLLYYALETSKNKWSAEFTGSGTAHGTDPSDPGDMVSVTTTPCLIGLLLDEFPSDGSNSVEQRLATAIMQKSDAWWRARALQQLALTSYELAYMSSFFGPEKQQLMLPMDDPAFTVTFTSPAARMFVDNHALVARNYTVSTMIVGSSGSAQSSIKKLGKIGGSYSLAFELPVDPVLLGQRTFFSCFDEDQFPHNSLETEEAYTYYDQTCEPGPAWPVSQSQHNACTADLYIFLHLQLQHSSKLLVDADNAAVHWRRDGLPLLCGGKRLVQGRAPKIHWQNEHDHHLYTRCLGRADRAAFRIAQSRTT